MRQPGDLLLAGAGLAGEQNPRVGKDGDFNDLAKQISPRGAFAHDKATHLVAGCQAFNLGPTCQAGNNMFRDVLVSRPIQHVGRAGGQQRPFHFGAQLQIGCQQRNDPSAVSETANPADAAGRDGVQNDNTAGRVVGFQQMGLQSRAH